MMEAMMFKRFSTMFLTFGIGIRVGWDWINYGSRCLQANIVGQSVFTSIFLIMKLNFPNFPDEVS